MGEGSFAIWQDLSALADGYAELSRELLSASRRLRAPGVLPAEALMGEVARLRRGFVAARERALGLARELGVEVTEGRGLESLKGVAALLERVTEAEEHREGRRARASAALAVLDRVLLLRHGQLDEYPPLAACQEQARALRLEIAGGPDGAHAGAVDGLAENDHPFASLLAMVDGHQRVSDEHWESLFEAVSGAFGRSLAAAVARSRIIAPPGPQGVQAPAAEVVPRGSLAVASAASGIAAPGPDPAADSEDPETPLTLPLRPEDGTDGAGTWWEGVVSGGVGGEAAPSPTAVDDVLTSVVSEAMAYLPRGVASVPPARKARRLWRRNSDPRIERLETVRLLSENVISDFGDPFTTVQFDPSLGTMTRVDLSPSGTLTSSIRAELTEQETTSGRRAAGEGELT
jgi:hypothetical protein